MTLPTDQAVAAQYEAYPYPARDPADEAKRLIVGSPSHLLEIDHYVFAGRRRAGLRCLVAGGGTGDGAIMLAQHLAERDDGGEVVYLDLSAAARRIAEARARARGLANIRFIAGSLLEVARLAPGPFDYIDCCGVLHHLDEPLSGLAALVSVLAPHGGLGLMLYGRYGRSGVYETQGALRRLSGGLDLPDRVALARRYLAKLPDSNRLARNPHLGDHQAGDDAGLVDLLLHPRDRAMTVPELAALAAEAGLRIGAFIPGAHYDPLLFIDDPLLRRRLADLDPLARAAVAEALCGNQKTHTFYAVRADNVAGGSAETWTPDLVPVLREHTPARLARAFARQRVLKADLQGLRIERPVPDGAAQLVALIDGRRSLGELHAALALRQPDLTWDGFCARYRPLHTLLNGFNLLLFSSP